MDRFAWFVITVAGLFGLVFGSFANVVIWRFPRGESLASPPSHCPECGHPIRWYDNIPVVSWLLLGGKCRDCEGRISGRYPLVELMSAVLWAAATFRFGLTWRTPLCIAFFYGLLLLTFIDIDTLRLPNPIVGALALLGAGAAVASALTGAQVAPLVGVTVGGPLASPLVAALSGGAVGAGLTGLTAWVYSLVRGRAGLGAGDVKLLGTIGLFTGPFVLLCILVGSVVGAVYGVAAALKTGESVGRLKVPFGPFLAAGAVVAVLWGPVLWNAYLGLVGLT